MNLLPQLIKYFGILIIALTFSFENAIASENLSISDTKIQAKYLTWNIFKTKRGRRDICYMISKPIESKSYTYKRGDAYFMVTNIKNNADEINVVSGFEYKPDTEIELSFGSRKFYLMPKLMRGWTKSRKDDIEIIKEMQKNEEMIISAITKDDRDVIDSYSLIGFSQAYFKMRELCK